MKRSVRALVLIGALLTSVVSVRAASTPVVKGFVSGLELCPQAWCGAAVFAGVFSGQVGANHHALGTIAVAVHHKPLPTVKDACADITDGAWSMWVGIRHLEGAATGELCYNGDNTFDVTVTMHFAWPGTGTSTFHGTLDHTVFPPTIRGEIVQ